MDIHVHLDCHLHLDGLIRVVSFHSEVFKNKAIDVFLGRVDMQPVDVDMSMFR